MFSYVSARAYEDVTLDGNRGNFLAVIGREENDKVLMKPLKKYYHNGNYHFNELLPLNSLFTH
jgi:hypothetical protein